MEVCIIYTKLSTVYDFTVSFVLNFGGVILTLDTALLRSVPSSSSFFLPIYVLSEFSILKTPVCIHGRYPPTAPVAMLEIVSLLYKLGWDQYPQSLR